ncbi:MAG: DUF790 family protein [Magnetococcales bacterium]|nr:DUF790 family protein [Magnetococcales bacterium]
MLTRDLLRFTLRGDRIHPRFIDVDNRLLLNLAEELIGIYHTGLGQSREELGEQTQPVVNAHSSPLVAKGLNKLLLDACAFREPDGELGDFRMALLERASDLLRSPAMGDLEQYRAAVVQDCGLDADTAAQRLHADLPIRQPLERFDPPTPVRLLLKYNMAQAQGLLVGAASVDATFTEPAIPRRRRLFRFLRFRRLLARIAQDGPAGSYRMHLDGPLSLLWHTQKYGLQLALFLPILAEMSRWSLDAEVTVRHHKPARLLLDQDNGPKPDPTHPTGHRPEEIVEFAREFRAQAPAGWTLRDDPAILPAGGQEIWIPDFSFKAPWGAAVHLELFHRWHAAQLLQRLSTIDRHPQPPALAIGVDRLLLKDAAVAQATAASPWFQRHGFPFNEFPPLRRVLDCLEGFLDDK